MDLTSGDGVYLVESTYIGMSKDDINALMDSDNPTEEEVNNYYQSMVMLFAIVGIDKNRNSEDIVNIVNDQLRSYGEGEDKMLKESDLEEIATFEDCTFYRAALTDESRGLYDSLGDEFKAEYDLRASYTDSIIEDADYHQPLGMFPGVVGTKLSFETTDIDGNPISSDELFAEHDITMVNVWATWCGYCVRELPELENINNRLADSNCAIVGLLGDGTDDEAIELGKSQLADAGCTYTCLLPYDGWTDNFDMSEGWPTSFLVDSTGTIVAIPIVGAEVGKYEDLIAKALAGETDNSYNNAAGNSVENSEGVYRIIVIDEEGNPVEGAMIQFCSGDTCNMAATDSDGIAIFDKPEDVYEVHVLKAPAGFQADNDKYLTTNTFSDLTIVLEKE